MLRFLAGVPLLALFNREQDTLPAVAIVPYPERDSLLPDTRLALELQVDANAEFRQHVEPPLLRATCLTDGTRKRRILIASSICRRLSREITTQNIKAGLAYSYSITRFSSTVWVNVIESEVDVPETFNA